MPARIGFARFAEMAMLGERVPAPKAADIGLINSAWPDDGVRDERRGAAHAAQQRPDALLRGQQAGAEPLAVRRMAEHLALEA